MIRDILVKRGEELRAQPPRLYPFTGHGEADALLNDLDRYPHAYVLACLMDRQIKAEKAWLIPYRFKEKLGSFEFGVLAALSLDQILALMSKPEPLHRFPNTMARIFHSAVRRIRDQYAGDASRIWQGKPSSATLVRRFREFEGAGPKIATMAANILVRALKVPVSDTYSIDISPDVHVRRVFGRLGLARADASDEELIHTARRLNPSYPGIFDFSVWEIGRSWCHPQAPECGKCYLRRYCPTAIGER